MISQPLLTLRQQSGSAPQSIVWGLKAGSSIRMRRPSGNWTRT